jgi:hypothetical protein
VTATSLDENLLLLSCLTCSTLDAIQRLRGYPYREPVSPLANLGPVGTRCQMFADRACHAEHFSPVRRRDSLVSKTRRSYSHHRGRYLSDYTSD